ncbi:MAG: RNA-binding S4 domain-containing protein [Candidatus Fimenecus sp.]
MKPIKITAKVVAKPKKQVQITTDFIRLDAALKLADAVQTGGHAKIVITEGEIKVNGEICSQRGKKLRKGDNFEFENTVYEIV